MSTVEILDTTGRIIAILIVYLMLCKLQSEHKKKVAQLEEKLRWEKVCSKFRQEALRRKQYYLYRCFSNKIQYKPPTQWFSFGETSKLRQENPNYAQEINELLEEINVPIDKKSNL